MQTVAQSSAQRTSGEVDYRTEYLNLQSQYASLELRYNAIVAETDQLRRQLAARAIATVTSSNEEGLVQRIEQIRAETEQQTRLHMEQQFRLEVDARDQHMHQLEHQYQNLQQYLEQLKTENQELIRMNQQYKSELEKLLNERNATDDASHYEAQLREKDEHITELSNQLAKYDAELEDLRDPRNRLGDTKHVEILETEIERLNTEILNKNTEIFKIKNGANEDKSRELTFELKSVKYESDRLTEMLQQKNTELAQLRELQSDVERKVSANAHLQEELQTYRSKLESTTEQYNKAEFELTRFRQTAGLKDSQLADVTAEKDRCKARLVTLEEQLDREREDSRFRTNQLEQKLMELERRSKSTEDTLRENLKKMSDSTKTLSLNEADRLARIKQLEDEVSQLNRQLEHERREHSSLRRTSEERIISLESVKIDLEGRLTQLNVELEHRKKEQSKALQPEGEARNYQVQLVELRSQLEKKSTELDNRRIEYENNLRKHRQDCEDSYRETLKLYEEKISELEAQVSRRGTSKRRDQHVRDSQFKRTTDEYSLKQSRADGDNRSLRKENERLRKLMSEYNQKVADYDAVSDSMAELQERIVEFETRINQLLDADAAPNSRQSGGGQNVGLKQIIRELNGRLAKFRQQNEQLKAKAARSKEIELKLKQTEQENLKLVEGYGQHEQKVERLISEVNRLRSMSQ